MSASGVDKAQLDEPGRDILLVSGYDAETGRDRAERAAGDRAAARLGRRDRALDDLPAAPRGRRDPPRPRVGRGHRRDARSTTPAAPRSSREAVADLVGAADDPAHAVVGLSNHGITATGEGLLEILDRIEPRVLRQVPMT